MSHEAAHRMHYLDLEEPPLVVVDVVLFDCVHLLIEQVGATEHEDHHASLKEACGGAFTRLNHSGSIGPRIHVDVEHFNMRYRLYLATLASSKYVYLVSFLDVH